MTAPYSILASIIALYIEMRLFLSEPQEWWDKVLMIFMLLFAFILRFLRSGFQFNLWSKVIPNIFILSVYDRMMLFRLMCNKF